MIDEIIKKIKEKGSKTELRYGDARVILSLEILRLEISISQKISINSIKAFNEISAITSYENYKDIYPEIYNLLDSLSIKIGTLNPEFYNADIGIVGFSNDKWKKHFSKWINSLMDDLDPYNRANRNIRIDDDTALFLTIDKIQEISSRQTSIFDINNRYTQGVYFNFKDVSKRDPIYSQLRDSIESFKGKYSWLMEYVKSRKSYIIIPKYFYDNEIQRIIPEEDGQVLIFKQEVDNAIADLPLLVEKIKLDFQLND
ncbi:hypothetical protein [Chryseobacterium sp. MMS23-Vi53]|uniref:hypothetical protein n=1 Tax=Chryseobacterium sp. MMS23-Vi53 TaxID=3386644 RepID=UPI0039ECA310